MVQRSPKKRAGASRQARKPSAKRTRAKVAPAKEVARATDTTIDPRVAAAIALALRDEEASEARTRELAKPPSPWTLAARARGVQTRWTR